LLVRRDGRPVWIQQFAPANQSLLLSNCSEQIIFPACEISAPPFQSWRQKAKEHFLEAERLKACFRQTPLFF